MSIDILQEKIRKLKNPSVVELMLPLTDLPPRYAHDAKGYGEFCRDLLGGLKGIIPAVRLSFGVFALLGGDGLQELLSPTAAQITAEAFFGGETDYPCDGLVVSGYLGSDIIKPFLPGCREGKKDLFVAARTGNKSAPELQDLLCGSRLVHTVAVDLINRFAPETMGKLGYSRIGALTAASSAESLRSLRGKYPRVFFLVDGYDSPSANAKNCSYAFDRLGHGAVVCAGETITCAWKQAQSDGGDFLEQAVAAAERMKKNLTRYVTIL